MNTTIAAISTPLGKGAISIVRMSGENALKIALKVFSCSQKIEPRKMVLGNLNLGQGSEKCLMVYFKAPFSYTGEDVVEFQIHGGIVVTRLALEKLVENGAKLAEPGEFTKRAFENGKISLDEAEAVVNEINSESEAQLKIALSSASGKLLKQTKKLQNNLTELLAEIEVSMDYPEEDENEIVRDKIFSVLKQTQNEIDQTITNAESLRFAKNGVNVALVGKTNVGKSSLLNALIGEEKAIVTSTKGTTRDVVEASCDIEGVRFNFYDTAGIRESKNAIEKIGIEKSKKFLAESDVVLFVVDGSADLDDDDKNVLKLLKKPYFVVVNKCDKQRHLKKQQNEIEVSALTGQNIEKLKKTIFDSVIKDEIDFSSSIVGNERQLDHLKNASKQIKSFFRHKNESLEILSMLIKSIWNELGKITGETENEDIISMIFSKFCVGK